MFRIEFKKSEQAIFLNAIVSKAGLTWSELANVCAISTRTLYDWRREKHLADYNTIVSLSEMYDIPLGDYRKIDMSLRLKKVAVLGGNACYKKYGLLGTTESRKKGGRVSQELRRKDPEKYRRLGCNARKTFGSIKYSERLAEVLGIIMGDGSLNKYQMGITLDRKVDREYAYFVSSLVNSIFGEKPTWRERCSVINLTLSGADLVDLLEDLGLKRGNKVTNQIKIPDWVLSNKKFQAACLRGLFDTDGCIYKHRKTSGTYIGWTFTNYSKPIIIGVSKILDNYSLKHSIQDHKKIYVYKFDDIIRYMDCIGSNNPKHLNRLNSHLKSRQK